METDIETLEIRDFPGTGTSDHLVPRSTSDTAPFWTGLNEGHLVLQKCSGCGQARYPVAPVCPYCKSSAFDWAPVRSSGVVFSWIRYHKSYQPEFEPLMPYSVVTVQLDDGPRMFGRWASTTEPGTGMHARVIGERWSDGRVLPAFIPEQENDRA